MRLGMQHTSLPAAHWCLVRFVGNMLHCQAGSLVVIGTPAGAAGYVMGFLTWLLSPNLRLKAYDPTLTGHLQLLNITGVFCRTLIIIQSHDCKFIARSSCGTHFYRVLQALSGP
jgi:hypothetical protein